MTGDEGDRRIAQAMRRYFELRRDAAALRKVLEQARDETGEAIAAFYDPGRNAAWAADIVRLHHLKRDMARQMRLAEDLAAPAMPDEPQPGPRDPTPWSD